ncbi:MAG: cyclin-dependent kinases regulatory subunit [Piptocephalis tieghemiana]|nr:MAG: cyclin-dependent kinases regulatory subunit [Piptocephalis tieghemiana]
MTKNPSSTLPYLTAQKIKELNEAIAQYEDDIYYADRYHDDEHEYRHVTLPKPLRKFLPEEPYLMQPREWRALGIRQSIGWHHYHIHKPEPHVFLFRREKDYQEKYPNGKPGDS